MRGGRNEKEERADVGEMEEEIQRGGENQTDTECDGLMGCQLMVHMEFLLLLRVELPRLAEHRPSASLSARLCFRNSLCSSLESLYFLPPPPGSTRR